MPSRYHHAAYLTSLSMSTTDISLPRPTMEPHHRHTCHEDNTHVTICKQGNITNIKPHLNHTSHLYCQFSSYTKHCYLPVRLSPRRRLITTTTTAPPPPHRVSRHHSCIFKLRKSLRVFIGNLVTKITQEEKVKGMKTGMRRRRLQ